MKKIYSLLMTIALAVGLSSCSDNWESQFGKGDGEGQVSLASLAVDVSDAEIVTSRATVDLSNFIITITDTQGAMVKTWSYSAMPEVFSLPVGSYKVTVESCEPAAAAWEQPYYVGSKEFVITNGEITNIGVVTCELKNVKVTILYSESLKKLLTDDVKVTVKAGEAGSQLVFTPTETRAGYFKYVNESMTIVATFEGTLKGETTPVFLKKTYEDVKPGTHYKITFSIKTSEGDMPDETGGVDLGGGLSLDADVDISSPTNVDGNINLGEDNEGDSDRPGSDEDPLTPPVGPDPGQEETITFTSPTLSFTAPNIVSDDLEGKVFIHADKGVAHLQVKISSDNDNFIASAGSLLPLDFDLAYPGDAGEGIASLGLPVGSDVINKTDVVFDITQFIPMLSPFPGTHTFTLTVTDNDNVQKGLKLILKAL